MSSELNQIAGLSMRWRVLLSGVLCLVAALCAANPSDAREQAGQAAHSAQVERCEASE